MANYESATVSEFAPGSTTPTATLTGLNYPIALAFDSSGNLYVANEAGTTVSKFAPGSTTPTATLTGLNNPIALAFDSSGNLYVANYYGNTVSRFTPGSTTPSATLTGLDNPIALVFDSSSNLYVANEAGGNGTTVSEFAPGSTTPTATLTGLANPRSLAFDSSGNLYVANEAGGNGTTVSEFAPAQSFVVSGPTSGTYAAGTAVNIAWTAGNVESGSKISLCYDGDTAWNGNEHWIEIDGVKAADGSGSYTWDTTGVQPGTYYVAGYLWNGGNTFTTSHLTQAITITAAAAQTFVVSGPTSGTYAAGTAVSIAWTAGNVKSGSKISLCYDGDTAWNGNEHWIEIDGVKAADGSGSYTWDTTGVQPGTYYVAGYLWNGGNTFTTSHLTQAITITAAAAQTFVVSGPTSGTYAAGAAVSIAWTAGNVKSGSKISLCYDEDTAWNGNEHWIEIDGVKAADGSGSYTWDTTGVQPGTYYVAGYLWNGGNTFTTSHLTQSITIAAALTLAAPQQPVPASLPSDAVLESQSELVPIVNEAIQRLAQATGSAALANVSVEIADLPGMLLGEDVGNKILIDRDAAGYGWFVDPTPADDVEFADVLGPYALAAGNGSPAANRVDLLTTVMHEMGHVLGYEHDAGDDLMNATLPLGERRFLAQDVADSPLPL